MNLSVMMLIGSMATAGAQVGGAYWYGEENRGKIMANQQPFNPDSMTCASWFYPLGTSILVTRTDVLPNIAIEVLVTDRGPKKSLVQTQNRVIDLSHAAFCKIANPDLGHVQVVVRPVAP